MEKCDISYNYYIFMHTMKYTYAVIIKDIKRFDLFISARVSTPILLRKV